MRIGPFLVLLLAASVVQAAPLALYREVPQRKGKKRLEPVTQQTFVQLAERAGPAVVALTVVRRGYPPSPAGNQAPSPGPPDAEPRKRGKEQGTGFLLNEDGYLLTNNHVVAEADEIRIRLHDEREFSGKLIGRDERTDLALVKMEGPTSLPKPAILGDSDDLQIGEFVAAIGTPFGLDHTFTVGIVSAKGRREVQPGGGNGFFDFIQTDASINPGNSGGPLLNSRGEVIGINTAVNVAGNGIGFAIPINLAKVIAKRLYENGKVVRSWLGVFPQQVSESLQKAFGLPERKGALVAEVVPTSPAEEAGLRPGDVILEFDGRPVRRADDLLWLVSITGPQKVTLLIQREQQRSRVTVQLQDAIQEEPQRPPRPPAPSSPLGIAVVEMTQQMAEQVAQHGGPSKGVVVMQIEPLSPAMEAGVERGDVVLSVNGKPIPTLAQYASSMKDIRRGELIRMLVRREDRKSWKNVWVAFVRR